jgi:hypothetical protein
MKLLELLTPVFPELPDVPAPFNYLFSDEPLELHFPT